MPERKRVYKKTDSFWKMDVAIDLAQQAFNLGEVPVGALLLSPTGRIISMAMNQVEAKQNPMAHAELLVLEKACSILNRKRLIGCTLVVTLEPCPMCAGAAMHTRVERIVFGAYDPKGGGIDHGGRIFSHRQTLFHPEIIGGIQEVKNKKILKQFFQKLR